MVWNKPGLSRLPRACALLFCCLFFVFSSSAAAEKELSVSVPAVVKGYSSCAVTVTAPFAGEAELRLYDSLENPWLIRKVTLSAGENAIPWDGLGANGEKLMSGPFRFDAVMKGADGQEYSASAKFSVQGFNPALALALPSSGSLYLDGKERWFVECWVPAECIVAMEVRDAAQNVVYSKSVTMKDADRDIIRWDGTGNSRKKVAPGEYTVRLYAKRNPDFAHTWPLSVRETTPESPAVSVTGPVLPERGMSDAEIWAVMMKPSVVINDTGSSRRFNLKESPSARSASAGVVCCATQGLEILSLEDGWARVRAYNYNNAEEITGYYPARDLAVVIPSPRYGVLVDKRSQTLTVYENGSPVGTVPVSTGLPSPAHPERETPAGAFLTDVHFSPNFAQEGRRYDYPLRFQGGNIIHSTGFERIAHTAYSVKDYSRNLPLLGEKASHGCVRVSPFASADCPVNMYWLWTHLPYHTRVIILDD